MRLPPSQFGTYDSIIGIEEVAIMERTSKAKPAERPPSARGALASLSLAMLLSSLGTSSANVSLPTLGQVFRASYQDVQWIVLAYLLAITTLVVSVGRLGDLVGRRRLMMAGLSMFTAASVLCGAAPTLGALIAARALQGFGAAVLMALTMAFVGDTVSKEKTGSAMGLLGTMSAVGTALGPSLGGVLIAVLGWRAIFLVNVPFGLLTLLLAYRFLPGDRQRSKADGIRFDGLGTLLLATTLAAFTLAMTQGRGHFGLLNAALLFMAALGGGLFALAETKAVSPLIRLALLRNPVLASGFAMSTLVTTVVMATLVIGPFYLSGALALGAAQVGLVMSLGPIVAALTGVPAGRLVDRFGTHRATRTGLMGMAAGASLFPVMPLAAAVPGYIAPLVILTAGYALFQAANNTSVMADIRPDQRGVVSGLLTLSRNLGLIAGASVMSAVFAFGSAAHDATGGRPEAIAAGMQLTFAVAVGLIMGALVIASAGRGRAPHPSGARKAVAWLAFGITGACLAGPASSQEAVALSAETTSPFKAMPLGDQSALTLSTESRLRIDVFGNGHLTPGKDFQQGLFRGVVGADWRVNPSLRVFGEVGTGQVQGRLATTTANFQNDASLQQLFVDVRATADSTLVGATLGRQEFADGPRQLLSLSDGPNLHRTWNGLRLYVHDQWGRVGAYAFLATRAEQGAFDDGIDPGERLVGLNASLVVASGDGQQAYLDPFWIKSENPALRSGDKVGHDDRHTVGLRLWGVRGPFKFDWTLAHQSGTYMERDIDAWGAFAVQSWALSEEGWRPRLTARLDMASGGGAYANGTLRNFNPLYASANYLSDGQFLSLSNLAMIAPGLVLSPTPESNLSIEYGFARRLDEQDAAYAGGMRAYPETPNVPGHAIGGVLRLGGSWSACQNLTLFGNLEHLVAGEVLSRAHLPSGTYGSFGATVRY